MCVSIKDDALWKIRRSNKVQSKNISRDSLLLSHQFRAGLKTTWPSLGCVFVRSFEDNNS